MTGEYSAHPALAAKQLQCHNLAFGVTTHQTHHRRHNSNNTTITVSGNGPPTKSEVKLLTKSIKLTSNATTKSNLVSECETEAETEAEANFESKVKLNCDGPEKALPVGSSDIDLNTNIKSFNIHDFGINFIDDGEHEEEDDHISDNDDVVDYNISAAKSQNTKDCVDCALSATMPTKSTTINSGSDEPDHLQCRISRLHQHPDPSHCNAQHDTNADRYAPIESHTISDGYISGLSSTISSPSASTVSSPLSTPTRLVPHLQHNHKQCCCQEVAPASFTSSILGAGANILSFSASTHQHHHHEHHDKINSNSNGIANGNGGNSKHSKNSLSPSSGCKKMQKFDPRLGPSPYRQLLPIVLCILSFATVFSILIVYMDTTEIRHKQFRLNMSRDYELFSVAQDDPTLIAFLREIHMRKYPMHFLKNARDTTPAAGQYYNFSAHNDGLTPEMAHYVADLVGGKANGAVIQSLPGAVGHLMTAPWLSETLNWAGVIVEPEPRRYFTLRKQNAQRPRLQVVHACVSPNSYPKEVTIHNEESEVRINSLLDEETSWFNTRVKCFPLYTIMLACNRVEYDLLSLGVYGHELEILQTLPFDKIQIEVISIHLPENDRDDIQRGYIQPITKFLMGKSYKLQKKFGRNYFYQRINTTNRTRKKDILLLKTP